MFEAGLATLKKNPLLAWVEINEEGGAPVLDVCTAEGKLTHSGQPLSSIVMRFNIDERRQYIYFEGMKYLTNNPVHPHPGYGGEMNSEDYDFEFIGFCIGDYAQDIIDASKTEGAVGAVREGLVMLQMIARETED